MYELLGLVSITLIIVHSEVFSSFREYLKSKNDTLGYWISCPMCLGFWIGLLGSLIIGSNIVIGALLTSLFSWSLYNIVTAFDAFGNYYTAATIYKNDEINDDGVNEDEQS
jgi:hypothetical protein